MKNIVLVFENVEVIEIPWNKIKSFHAIDVTDSLFCFRDGIKKYQYASEIEMIIDIDFLKNYEMEVAKMLNRKQSGLERLLEFNDITIIELNYLNQKNQIYVEWSSDEYNFSENDYQKTIVNNNTVEISIKKENNKELSNSNT